MHATPIQLVRTHLTHGDASTRELVVLGVAPERQLAELQRAVERAHPGGCWTGQFSPADVERLIERWERLGERDAASALANLHHAHPSWWLVAASDA